MRPSDRPRTLRELRPDLFIAGRRRRARDAASRAAAALSRFLGGLLRRQGQEWRALCDELRKEEAAARREAGDLAREVRTKDRAIKMADERARVAEAAARHADGERDEAQKAAAAVAAQLADLTEEARRWRCAAGNLIEAGRADYALRRIKKEFGERVDEDPRQGRPGGGTDLLPRESSATGADGYPNVFTATCPAGEGEEE